MQEHSVTVITNKKLVLCLFEMDRVCSTNGEKRNAYGILVRKPEGRRALGRPRRKWVDNIKMDVR
jgi:hypothetical protein